VRNFGTSFNTEVNTSEGIIVTGGAASGFQVGVGGSVGVGDGLGLGVSVAVGVGVAVAVGVGVGVAVGVGVIVAVRVGRGASVRSATAGSAVSSELCTLRTGASAIVKKRRRRIPTRPAIPIRPFLSIIR
jgi:hypothetical protein